MYKFLLCLLIVLLFSCTRNIKIDTKSDFVLVLPINIEKKIYDLISLDQSFPESRIQLDKNYGINDRNIFFSEYGYIYSFHENIRSNVIDLVKISEKPVVRKIVMPEEVNHLEMKDHSSAFILNKRNQLFMLNFESEALQLIRDSFAEYPTGFIYKNDIVYLHTLENNILLYDIESDKISDLTVKSNSIIAVNIDASLFAYVRHRDSKIAFINLKTGDRFETDIKGVSELLFLNKRFLVYIKPIYFFQFSTLPPNNRTFQYILFDTMSGQQSILSQISINVADQDGLGPFIIKKSDAKILINTMGLKK